MSKNIVLIILHEISSFEILQNTAIRIFRANCTEPNIPE